MVAVITLLLILVNSGEVVEDFWGYVLMVCVFILFIVAIFLVINIVLAFIEGWKKDKKEFFKLC